MDPESRPTVKVERIIALKRYEQPPPGYFTLLPGRIIRRIEQGEGQSSFWAVWRPAFNARSLLALGLGVAVCGVVTIGIWRSPKFDQNAGGGEPAPGGAWAAASSSLLAAGDASPGRSAWLGSTNPVTAPQTDADADSARAWLYSTNPVPAPPSGYPLLLTPGARAIPVSLNQQN